MKKLILLFILAFIHISCKSSQYVLISDNKETETITDEEVVDVDDLKNYQMTLLNYFFPKMKELV